MTDEERQRLSVRTIRVSLVSALRYARPDEVPQCKARAQQLLAIARGETTAKAVIAEIEALQAELDGEGLRQQLGEH